VCSTATGVIRYLRCDMGCVMIRQIEMGFSKNDR
jgi:hypothetical protein